MQAEKLHLRVQVPVFGIPDRLNNLSKFNSI